MFLFKGEIDWICIDFDSNSSMLSNFTSLEVVARYRDPQPQVG